MQLNTQNKYIIEQYNSIVNNIKREINLRNISVIEFCESLNLDVNEFLDSLIDIKCDFSYYLKVLEALRKY